MNKRLDYSSNTLIDTLAVLMRFHKYSKLEAIKLLQSIKHPDARWLKCFRAFLVALSEKYMLLLHNAIKHSWFNK